MKIVRFLGSIYFALFLIGATALFVAAGTILESKTASHRYAALFTYSNPLFIALLVGFFVNILLSALSRYPYQKKHIPFLITHLGMLILLTGTFVKGFSGLQGNLRLLEGGTSDTVLLPETYALQIYTPEKQEQLLLTKELTLKGNSAFQIDLVGYAPHSAMRYETWVKQGHVFIDGLKPIPLQTEGTDLKAASRVRLQPDPAPVWTIYAMKTDKPDEVLAKVQSNGILPALLFAETGDATQLSAVAEKGKTHSEIFTKERPQKLAVYDQGYGGYRAYFQFEEITLETPIFCRCLPQPIHSKFEDLRPQLTVRVRSEGGTEFITLPYEPHGEGLKWPILKGSALIRFQPQQQMLPYKIRLRQARQITYPHTAQPFSYESDVVFTSKTTGERLDKTLSMNHVHETREGYRFYLANMTPLEEGAVKEAHIVVNHDPAKYTFTYPGAVLMTIGILLLFWWNPYKTKI